MVAQQPARSSGYLRILLTSLLYACAATAQATAFRCAGPDGKVVYSDQACVQGHTGGVVKGTTATPPSAAKSTSFTSRSPSVQDNLNKAQRDRVHASLSPECQALGNKASRVLQSDSTASMDAVKRAVSEFESRCGDQLAKGTQQDNAGGFNQVTLDSRTCSNMRQALQADRARLGRMTDKQKMAFAKQQNEVSVACP